jgi:hypothetical protein
LINHFRKQACLPDVPPALDVTTGVFRFALSHSPNQRLLVSQISIAGNFTHKTKSGLKVANNPTTAGTIEYDIFGLQLLLLLLLHKHKSTQLVTMNVPMNNGVEPHRRQPSPATADNERIQGGRGGSSSFRNAAACKKGGNDQVSNTTTTNEDEDALLTFHPVDEPELEVVVSNIFSVSSLAKVGSSSCDDDDNNDNDKDKEDVSNRKQLQQKKRPRVDSHVPIYISDEECDDASFRRGNDDDDDDNDEEEASVSSSAAAAHERDVFHRLVKEGAAKVAAAAAAQAAAKAPEPEISAPPSAPDGTGGSDASTNPSQSASKGMADGAKSSDESRPLDGSIKGCHDNEDDGGVEYDYEDGEEEDDYETRKRKEEASMDEEQLRKKRRVEEEERVARNNLWRQSIKRSMFLEPPGSIMSKRATL